MSDEGRQAVLDLDERRTRPQRLGVEIVQDQPRLWPERQSDIDELAFFRVQGPASLDLQMRVALDPVPEPGILARIAVGHDGLAQHGVLVEDLRRVLAFDLDMGAQDPALDEAEMPARR